MGVMAGHDAVLDLVYETSVDPTLWPRLLERFAGLMGGHAAALRSYDLLSEAGAVMAVGLDAEVLDGQFRNFASRNPLKSSPEQLRQMAKADFRYVPGMKRDVEWLPKSEFERTEYYNDLYRPLDIHADISIGFASANAVWTGVDVYRAKSQGAFTDEDIALCEALLPHLVRAWKLSRKFAGARGVGEALADFVDASPHGLFILDGAGLVQHVNSTGRRLLARPNGLQLVGGRLCAGAPDTTRQLHGLIERAGRGDHGPRIGGSLALANPGGLRPLSLTVAPMRAEQASPLFDGPAVLVCVTDLEASVSLPQERLRDLFNLTPAETRVAVALFEGLDPKLAGEKLDVSVWTVRRHLAEIFAKTQTGSQAALARLMMRTLGAGAG